MRYLWLPTKRIMICWGTFGVPVFEIPHLSAVRVLRELVGEGW